MGGFVHLVFRLYLLGVVPETTIVVSCWVDQFGKPNVCWGEEVRVGSKSETTATTPTTTTGIASAEA